MDVRQLRYFLAIAEEGSISRAAERLGVAQPSLSQHIRHLEEDLGVELLVRSARGVATTESGAVLVAHARGILRAVEQAREDVRHLSDEPRGVVAVGLPSSVSMVLTVPLAETVRVDLPHVTLRTMEAMSGHVLTWLEEGMVDLGILFNAAGLRHLMVRELMVEDLYLIGPTGEGTGQPRFGGVMDQPASLSDVTRLELALPGRPHGLRELIERHARACGVRLNVAIEMDALSQIKELVARGSAYSILSLSAVQGELDRGELIATPLVDPPIRRTVNVVRNPSRMTTRASQEVEARIVDVARELVTRGRWPADLTAPAEP